MISSLLNSIEKLKVQILLTTGLLIGVLATGQSSTLTILTPNGGESYVSGQTIGVTWENTGDPEDLMIEVTEDGGAYWYYMAYVNAGDTSTTLYFQYYGNPTDLAKVRISSYANPSNSDESDSYFTILESPVYFNSPYFGDRYYVNHPVNISWYSYTLTSFNLDFSYDNGATWNSLAANYTGFDFEWDSPSQITDQALIRISDPADPASYGLSPVFSIIDEPVAVITQPNGGEIWNYGEYQTVSWDGSNLPPYVNIDFSYDGGLNWTSLGFGYSEPDSGSAQVSVPYYSTENAKVRVTDYSYGFTLDESDATFSVVVPPVIVYYPSGGEYYNGQTTYLNWLALQEISLLNFELSTDNGQTWTLIAEDIPANQGYYYWTVNGTPSQDCLIRMSNSTDPSQFGLSGQFTILETPVLTLQEPSAGEIWNTGTPYTISWTYENPAANYIYLEYSVDNGSTWSYIGYVTIDGPQGSFNWTTPDVSSDQCRIRIMDYYLNFVADTSEIFTIITFPETPICMVSVDSTTNHNVIVWEKPASELIDRFVVYKETSEANVYEIIGTLDYNEQAVLTDTNSNPNVKAYRYRLGFMDAQGHYFPAGADHQTIHLTINQGVGNTWNLIWTGYVGFEASSYNIHRKTGSGNYEPIGSTSASFTSYTDLTAPSGDVYYVVEVTNPNGCNPARSAEYSSSYSNVATNAVLGVDDPNRELSISTYPNPVKDKLTITTGEMLKGEVRISISDLLGHTVYSENIQDHVSNDSFTVNTSDFKEGIYMIKISAENGQVTRKIVVNR